MADDPCEKLLTRLEHQEHEEKMREDFEVVALFLLVFIAVACYLLSVAIDISEAIVSIPPAAILAYHKRERIRALMRMRRKEMEEMMSDE